MTRIEMNVTTGEQTEIDLTPAEVAAAQASARAWEQRPDQYRALRATAYPAIGDQLDALWKGGAAAAEMLVQIQNVKARYPK